MLNRFDVFAALALAELQGSIHHMVVNTSLTVRLIQHGIKDLPDYKPASNRSTVKMLSARFKREKKNAKRLRDEAHRISPF